MHYHHIALQDFLQSYSLLVPTQEILTGFKQNAESYLAKVANSKNESEEHQKNLLRDFLSQTFGYDCNTKGRIDLAIYEDSTPKVIFETKKLNASKDEFLGGGETTNFRI